MELELLFILEAACFCHCFVGFEAVLDVGEQQPGGERVASLTLTIVLECVIVAEGMRIVAPGRNSTMSSSSWRARCPPAVGSMKAAEGKSCPKEKLRKFPKESVLGS